MDSFVERKLGSNDPASLQRSRFTNSGSFHSSEPDTPLKTRRSKTSEAANLLKRTYTVAELNEPFLPKESATEQEKRH